MIISYKLCFDIILCFVLLFSYLYNKNPRPHNICLYIFCLFVCLRHRQVEIACLIYYFLEPFVKHSNFIRQFQLDNPLNLFKCKTRNLLLCFLFFVEESDKTNESFHLVELQKNFEIDYYPINGAWFL